MENFDEYIKGGNPTWREKSYAWQHVTYLQSANSTPESGSKCKNCTLEETAVLQILSENGKATQKQIAEAIGKSERTVKSITANLVAKGILKRENGKRNGFWTINNGN